MAVELVDRSHPVFTEPLRLKIAGENVTEPEIEAPEGWNIDAEIVKDPRLLPIIAAGYLPIIPSGDNNTPNAQVARSLMGEFKSPAKAELTPEEIEVEDAIYIEKVLENTPFPEYDKWDFDITYARDCLKERREQAREQQRQLAQIMSVHKAIFLWKADSQLSGEELLQALPESAPKETLAPDTNHNGRVKEPPAEMHQTFDNPLLGLKEAMQRWVHKPNQNNGNHDIKTEGLPQIDYVHEVTLPALFVVGGYLIGKDTNEVSDNPERIEKGRWIRDWRNDYCRELTQELERISNNGLAPGREMLSSDRNLEISHKHQVDYQLNHMAQNYLLLISSMKSNDRFPREWTWGYRLEQWEKYVKPQNEAGVIFEQPKKKHAKTQK